MGAIHLAHLPELLFLPPRLLTRQLARVDDNGGGRPCLPGPLFQLLLGQENVAVPGPCGHRPVGVGFAPFNQGASTFFIYAAALAPFAVDHSRTAFKILVGVLALIALESWLLHLRSEFWLTSFIVTIPVGAANIYFAQRTRDDAKLRMANDEIEHLAKVAERERIARDLHDVLGHTLSVIILKAELAGKLLERDSSRAKTEIGDVENIARQALSEVRQAIRGYRAAGLSDELARATATLETAGLSVECKADKLPIGPAQETVLSLVIREAVTNVVRHARARNCSVLLEQQNDSCRLQVRDDGQGGILAEGHGLRGMRERIEALGGTLQHSNSGGTILTITLPLEMQKERNPA